MKRFLIFLILISIIFYAVMFKYNLFDYETYDSNIGMELKMASDRNANLEVVKSIINDSQKMKEISPWVLGQALSFAAAQYKAIKAKRNKQDNPDDYIKIIQMILNSGYPIDPDYLGHVLIFAAQIGNDDITKAILNNQNAKNIDSSFKILIFFQAYFGGSSMPRSFLIKALEEAVKGGYKEIVEQLLEAPAFKKRVSKKDISNVLKMAISMKHSHIESLLSKYLKTL